MTIILKRQLSVFPTLYKADCRNVLWATHNATKGDFYRTLGTVVAKRLEVPL